MKKKIFGTILAVGLLVSLAACGSSKESSTAKSSAATSQKADNTKKLAAIKEKKEIVMGTSADFAPFEFPQMNGGKEQIVGVDVDIAQAIADDLGVTLKVMNLSFDNLLPSLQQGKLDMVLSGVSATKERKKNVDFSEAYFTPKQQIVIQKDKLSEYKSVADFKGKKIGAQKGSIQEDVAKDQIKGAQVSSLPKVTTMLMEIKQGTLDGMVLESAIAQSYVAQNADLAIADVTLKSSDDEAYAVALPKNSGELVTEVNKVVKKLQDEGKIDEFMTKNTDLAEKTADSANK
ncbi:transporter substrate-binding domain-containing protein [Enterococcus hirae]|nr:transporter substrate-binding domain-containing protein [Enterococcus hirae]